MKKQLLVVLLALVLVFSLVTCVACQDNPEPEQPTTYTLTYAAGGGSGTAPAASTHEAGAEITLAANMFTAPEGKEFDGWLVDGAKKAAGDKITMPAKNLTITAQWKVSEQIDPEPEITVYYHNVDGWEEVNAYAWTGEGADEVKHLGTWPGTAMTAVADHEGWMQITIKADIEDGAINVIFNAGNNQPQTGNLSIANATDIYFTKTAAYASFAAAEAEVPVANTVVYFYNADGWASVYVHSWIDGGANLTGGSWPGKVASTVDGHEGWVSYEFDRNITEEGHKVIFHNNSGTQTDNLDVVGENIYFINAQTNYAYSSFEAAEAALGSEVQKYTVTWLKSDNDSLTDSVVGEVPAQSQVAEGATITMPAADTLTLAHYTLSKWRVYEYVVSNGEGSWVTLENVNPGAEYTMPGKNIQIKAVWTQNQVTVSFDANGGTGTMAPIQKGYNTYLNYKAINCTFTAPENMKFAGWALSADGPVINDSTDPKMSAIASADDTVTLYAIWTSTTVTPITPSIDAIKGSWTATGHTIDIIAHTNAANEYIVGYAVLDGKYLLAIMDVDGAYEAYSSDLDLYYGIALSEETLTLTPEEGSAIALTGKTELANADRATFEGNWIKNGTTQKWIITADEVYYGVTDLKTVSISMIIGNYLVITYEQADYTYIYVLVKQGENLEGWYDAAEVNPVAATFIPGDYVTLTVEGKLNQAVNSGSAPDASKIVVPAAPEGQEFSKWVIAGTETEFDVTAAMTANVAIEAVYADSTANVSKLYEGSTTISYGTFTKKDYILANFVINFGSLEASCEDDSGWQLTTTIREISKTNMNTSVYGADASYYEVYVTAADNQQLALYIIVNADQTKITLCDSDDTPYDDGEYVLSTEPQESRWDDLTALKAKLAELCEAGTKLYFENPIVHENNSFLGVQFTKLGENIAIKIIYLKNGAEAESATFSGSIENGNMLRIQGSGTNYIRGNVFALDKNGDLYVTSFYYKSFYNTATKLVAANDDPISIEEYGDLYIGEGVSFLGFDFTMISIYGNEEITFYDEDEEETTVQITKIEKDGDDIVVTFEYGTPAQEGTITIQADGTLAVSANGTSGTYEA